MIKDYKSVIKQNLKCLVLTIPGERVMEPNYGVGLTTYLFSNAQQGIQSLIQDKIEEQVKMFMPAVRLENIQFNTNANVLDTNSLILQIVYSIPSIATVDLLEITI